MSQRRAVLIAGPTASGKSAHALARARATGGIIVNTDSMQVYDTLRVLSARPSAEDEALAEHRLYGFVSPSQRFSTGQWLREVEALIGRSDPAQELIFVGGTGLYFDALTNGFAEVPEISPQVALAVERELDGMDEAERMALLAAEDAETAARLKVADPQRVIRALAVKRQTGRALSSFQQAQSENLLSNWAVERLVLWPERDLLRSRIADRFSRMFENGAVEEVKTLLEQQVRDSLPAMKAIGVPEIRAWLEGRLTQSEAIDRATIATQQYAKRQRTWFRNRMADWPRLS